MDNAEEKPIGSASINLSEFFERVERIYLRILRIAILVIATLLILYTAYLFLTGLYQVSQSPSSVREATASVVANEIVDAEEIRVEDEEKTRLPDPAEQKFYSGFVARYYKLFRTKFEPYRQAEDKTLARDEFDDSFVKSAARLAATSEGSLNFEKDRAELEALLATMTSAAAEPKAIERLRRYKAAKKIPVKREVQKERTEYRRGWNSLSTNCDGWYYSPVGCAEQRAVQVPYTETVTSMEFPKGTQSHSQIFHAMQDRYFSLLEERRLSNAADAENRRTAISVGNVEGAVKLGSALHVFAMFLGIMFFFLLIAIERHQRRISALVPSTDNEPPSA